LCGTQHWKFLCLLMASSSGFAHVLSLAYSVQMERLDW
jgi:hypothetical protein